MAGQKSRVELCFHQLPWGEVQNRSFYYITVAENFESKERRPYWLCARGRWRKVAGKGAEARGRRRIGRPGIPAVMGEVVHKIKRRIIIEKVALGELIIIKSRKLISRFSVNIFILC